MSKYQLSINNSTKVISWQLKGLGGGTFSKLVIVDPALDVISWQLDSANDTGRRVLTCVDTTDVISWTTDDGLP